MRSCSLFRCGRIEEAKNVLEEAIEQASTAAAIAVEDIGEKKTKSVRFFLF